MTYQENELTDELAEKLVREELKKRPAPIFGVVRAIERLFSPCPKKDPDTFYDVLFRSIKRMVSNGDVVYRRDITVPTAHGPAGCAVLKETEGSDEQIRARAREVP